MIAQYMQTLKWIVRGMFSHDHLLPYDALHQELNHSNKTT